MHKLMLLKAKQVLHTSQTKHRPCSSKPIFNQHNIKILKVSVLVAQWPWAKKDFNKVHYKLT